MWLKHLAILVFNLQDFVQPFSSPNGCVTNLSTPCLTLSSTSSTLLAAQNVGATETVSTKSRTNFPYQNTNQYSSYVPDGMTKEQYDQIKKKDLAKLQGKDFGAWGPRFNKVDGDPDGNWFNSPKLWTLGFTLNDGNGAKNGVKKNVSEKVGEEAGVNKNWMVTSMVLWLRRYGLAYLALLLSTQFLHRSLPTKFAMGKFLIAKQVGARIFLPFLALRPLEMVASLAARKNISVLIRNGTTKMAVLVGLLMAAISVFLR